MNLEVCFSPNNLHLYDIQNSIVVVIDVLRATSSMCVGFAYGVKKMYPVESIEECKTLQEQGCVGAAERNGEKVDGFELSNSPFDYMNTTLKGRDIAITTTNGTRAIEMAKAQGAKQIVIGAFTNFEALVAWLLRQKSDVLLLCAGWKDKFNLEDTLFAGAVIHQCKKQGTADSDSATAAELLYVQARTHIYDFLKNSNHAKRLSHLNIQRDITFCLQESLTKVIPVYKDNYLYDIHAQEVAEEGIAELISFSSSLIEDSSH